MAKTSYDSQKPIVSVYDKLSVQKEKKEAAIVMSDPK